MFSKILWNFWNLIYVARLYFVPFLLCEKFFQSRIFQIKYPTVYKTIEKAGIRPNCDKLYTIKGKKMIAYLSSFSFIPYLNIVSSTIFSELNFHFLFSAIWLKDNSYDVSSLDDISGLAGHCGGGGFCGSR